MVILSLMLAMNQQVPVASTRVSGFVFVDGVKLHYLDWGGRGEVLLFLAGTGDIANAFDDFAPQFVDRFRVIALTRRGYGKSDKPLSGYDIPTLSMDVLGYLDIQGIKRANIICHSAGGDETTYIATQFPERVGKLVYMEAAYNRAAIVDLEKLDPMGAEEPRSREQELHWKGMDDFRPDFKAIKAPVLSFYSIFERHPAVDEETSPELKVKAEKFVKEVIQPYQWKNIEQFRKDAPKAKVIVIRNSDHYFFEDPKKKESVIATIRDFLVK
ncbi:MAG: alpha/beta fold hydrolase [Fimbriimonadaceae bacterium]